MPQPKDYAEGWDPFKTDPLYRPLLMDDEVIEPSRTGPDQREEGKEQGRNRTHTDSLKRRPEGPTGNLAPELPDSSHENSMPNRFFDFLIPPVDDTPENIRRYRIAQSLSVIVLFLICAAGYGAFERVGISGFARADTIRSKIQEATQPLEAQISKQTAVLDKVSQRLVEQLAAGTAAEIRTQTAKRCIEKSSDERERINREIDRLQTQYAEFKGSGYLAPSCGDL